MKTPPLMALDHASKSFDRASFLKRHIAVHAMRDVSLSVDKGKALALVGESGSGKSTCARAIAGLIGLTSGRVLYRGKDISEIRTRKARFDYAGAVQMIFQDPFSALNPTHNVRHHLARPLHLHGRAANDIEEQIRGILREVELSPDETIAKYPHELSGGERQRVNLARALAVGAKLIIADEPTSMLDVSIRRSVLDLMRRLKEERGIAFVYITHDIATGSYFAEETAVMFAGQIVEHGPSPEVTHNPRHAYSELLLSALPQLGKRIEAGSKSARDFAARAEAIRLMMRNGKGELVEPLPGHFVRDL